jgi:uncharacterized membrane protein YqjE
MAERIREEGFNVGMPLTDRLPEMSTAELLEALGAEMKILAREEGRVAKAELQTAKTGVARGGLFTGLGAVLAVCGFLALMNCAIWLLALVLPFWAAALIVGVVVMGAGGALGWVGLGRLKAVGLTRTMGSLKEDQRWAESTFQRIRSARRAHASA